MTITATCPKCFGTGHLSHFAHINNGDCYMCGTVGTVNARQATVQQATHRAAHKTIKTSLGDAVIMRHGAGFRADFEGGAAWFDIADGEIVIDAVSDAFVARGLAGRVSADLASAYRAANH